MTNFQREIYINLSLFSIKEVGLTTCKEYNIYEEAQRIGKTIESMFTAVSQEAAVVFI